DGRPLIERGDEDRQLRRPPRRLRLAGSHPWPGRRLRRGPHHTLAARGYPPCWPPPPPPPPPPHSGGGRALPPPRARARGGRGGRRRADYRSGPGDASACVLVSFVHVVLSGTLLYGEWRRQTKRHGICAFPSSPSSIRK